MDYEDLKRMHLRMEEDLALLRRREHRIAQSKIVSGRVDAHPSRYMSDDFLKFREFQRNAEATKPEVNQGYRDLGRSDETRSDQATLDNIQQPIRLDCEDGKPAATKAAVHRVGRGIFSPGMFSAGFPRESAM
mmetsp:Transcript_12161/g.21984  ORF Transcript_12161/g.21984 Transcript_12161/m.21984 type:complete len:133 (-) Transcript_12161:1178-1576(-)